MRSLRGVNALLMTPFTDRGEVDENSMRRHIDDVIDAGVTGLVAMGRVGEVERLSLDEQRQTMGLVVDLVAGRVPTGFGIIDSSFEDGLTAGRHAREMGGDFVMSRPPLDGDYVDYYQRLADIIPIMIYDYGATQGDLSVERDLLPLAQKIDNIVALKISASPDKVADAKRFLDFPVLTAWDMGSLLGYELGSDGVIGSTAALNPAVEVRYHESVMAGRMEEARDIYYGQILPLMNLCWTDPHAYSSLKHVLFWRGVIATPVVRRPNPDIGSHRRWYLLKTLKRVGIETPAVSTPI